VIGVSVGHHYYVETADGAGPEVGRDYIFTDIEGAFLVAAEPGNAAGVDEHELALGQCGEEAVALAYIDDAEFQVVFPDVRTKGVDDQKGEEDTGAHPGQDPWPMFAKTRGGQDQGERKQNGQPEGWLGNAPIGLPPRVHAGRPLGHEQEPFSQPGKDRRVQNDGGETNRDYCG